MRELTASEVYEWTGAVLAALRNALDGHRFIEVLPAILSERYEPGARHSVAVLGDRALPTVSTTQNGSHRQKVIVTGERHYYLPVSHCVEKQLALEHVERVYCMAPCVRLLMEGENLTGRHLYTFFQVEIEWRTENVDEIFTTIEAVISEFAAELLRRLSPSARLTSETVSRIEALARTPYERVPFADARSTVAEVGGSTNPHAAGDLTHAEERVLSERATKPFWITDYPDGVRDSLYRRTATGTFATFDLVLPAGYGELSTGGLRPDSGEDILRQASRFSDSPHKYYAQWKDRTKLQTGGLGIGLERLVRYCSGVPSILDLRFAHDHGPNAAIRGLT